MDGYEHGGNGYAHPGCVDFSASLNPLGMPGSVRAALCAQVDAFAAYPDPACTELTVALAAFEGVPEAWIVPCAGATDAFERICRALRPRRALVCAPCYAGYEQALVREGATVRVHELHECDDFDVGPGIVRALSPDIDLVFVANPNNPTGRCLGRDVLRALLERAAQLGATVVLDECFIDLARRERSNDLLASHMNLVLVKACTKTFSLAGVRLGHILCANERTTRLLRAMGPTWCVSVPAQVAGVASLADADYLQRSQTLVARERDRLQRALSSLDLRVVPSEANYVLFRGPQGLAEALLAHGVLIRSCANFRGLDERWYRVAVRMPEQNDALLRALEGALGVAPRGRGMREEVRP